MITLNNKNTTKKSTQRLVSYQNKLAANVKNPKLRVGTSQNTKVTGDYDGDEIEDLDIIDEGDDDFVATPKYAKDSNLATFKDVQGYDDEKARLSSVCNAILLVKNKTKIDGYIPKGIILSGLPGLGKTMLTEAIISKCNVPYFSVKPDEEGYKHLRATYEKAAELAPAIIVLDDVDRLVSIEGPTGFVSDSTQNALSVLLDCLDGLGAKQGVLTIATTNDYYGLDSALTRAGRMDLRIAMDLPDDKAREEILDYYLKKYDIFSNVDPKIIAKKTRGFTGAELKSLVNDIWLDHITTGKKKNSENKKITENDFQKRILEIHTGALLKNTIKNANDLKRTCYHEAGHVVVDYIVNHRISDACVLQAPSADFLGFQHSRIEDTDETGDFSEVAISNEVAVCMGGRAAEALIFNDYNTGPSGDIEIATRNIHYGIISGVYGLDLIPVGEPDNVDSMNLYSPFQPEALQIRWQQLQTKILENSYATALTTLKEHKDLLNTIADVLAKNYLMSGEDLKKIIEMSGYKDGKRVVITKDSHKKK